MTTYYNQIFPFWEVTFFSGHRLMCPFGYSLTLCPFKFAFCYANKYGEQKGSHLSSVACHQALLRDKRYAGEFPSRKDFTPWQTL